MICPELAAPMRPVHPGDASYAHAAAVLAGHDCAVTASTAPLQPALLAAGDLLVIAHESEDRWESATGVGSPRLSAAELGVVEAFVRDGGGLDRLLRFPIAGARVRNHDGLGGRLPFAFLHTGGYLHWVDNRLTSAWERVSEGVPALRDELYALYRAGIDRIKLAHWSAAHDLVARHVPPASRSRWAAGVRQFTEVADPRPCCDEVLPDEFPLSIFYGALQGALASA